VQRGVDDDVVVGCCCCCCWLCWTRYIRCVLFSTLLDIDGTIGVPSNSAVEDVTRIEGLAVAL
jgi:hypothetical protein